MQKSVTYYLNGLFLITFVTGNVYHLSAGNLAHRHEQSGGVERWARLRPHRGREVWQVGGGKFMVSNLYNPFLMNRKS